MNLSNHIDNAKKTGGKLSDFFFGTIRVVAYIMFALLVVGAIYR